MVTETDIDANIEPIEIFSKYQCKAPPADSPYGQANGGYFIAFTNICQGLYKKCQKPSAYLRGLQSTGSCKPCNEANPAGNLEIGCCGILLAAADDGKACGHMLINEENEKK